jgi:phosphoribosyl 1,2-cyclic phosphodiesterase
MVSRGEKNQTYHIFISHVHWDHIQGFPFFTPAFIPGNKVYIYGFHQGLEESFIRQQASPNFPVSLDVMQADINFVNLILSREYELAGYRIKGIKQNHPGDSFGYSFEKDGKKIIYSTDNEYTVDDEIAVLEYDSFIKDADLLVFDAQYSLADAIYTKEQWGHSSNIIAVELAVNAGVKHLCLFHNEPANDDVRLDEILYDTRKYLKMYDQNSSLRIDVAYDGLLIEL